MICPRNPRLGLKRQSRLVGRRLVINSSVSRAFVWGVVLRFTKSVSTPLWSNQRGNTPPTDRWSCVACARVSARVLGGGGGGLWGVWGEEEEVVKCGERSVEAQLVRPPLQPAAASDEAVSSPPARPSSLSVLPPPTPPHPALPLSRAFCRLSPAVPSSLLSSPATMHPDLRGGGVSPSCTHICKQARSKASQDLSLIQEATPEAGVNLTAGSLLFRRSLLTLPTCFSTPRTLAAGEVAPEPLTLWSSSSLAKSLRLP